MDKYVTLGIYQELGVCVVWNLFFFVKRVDGFGQVFYFTIRWITCGALMPFDT